MSNWPSTRLFDVIELFFSLYTKIFHWISHINRKFEIDFNLQAKNWIVKRILHELHISYSIASEHLYSCNRLHNVDESIERTNAINSVFVFTALENSFRQNRIWTPSVFEILKWNICHVFFHKASYWSFFFTWKNLFNCRTMVTHRHWVWKAY